MHTTKNTSIKNMNWLSVPVYKQDKHLTVFKNADGKKQNKKQIRKIVLVQD